MIIGITPYLYLYNTRSFLLFQDGIFHKKVPEFLCKPEISKSSIVF